MRKVRADAAQRRIEVTQGCASGTDRSTELADEASKNGFRTKAEEDDANEEAILQAFIELIQEEEREKYGTAYVPPSQENPAGPRKEASPAPPSGHHENPRKTLPHTPTSDASTSSIKANNNSYESAWTCLTCTLENPPNFLCCDVCASERPLPSNVKSIALEERPTPAGRAPAKPPNQKKRPAQGDQKGDDNSTPRDTFTFKNRTRALDSLTTLDRDVNKRPLGWVCNCGTFMESQWWTCSLCGTMKPSS